MSSNQVTFSDGSYINYTEGNFTKLPTAYSSSEILSMKE